MPMKEKKTKFQEGLEIRKTVLGEEYVNKSISGATDFIKPLQELVTEYCWGTIWARTGLPRRTRSLINLGILTALNRPNELKLHVMGAVRNGCMKEEILETLLQATVYCGVPAGVEAFRVANEALKEPSEKRQ
jgi:4-carboxymuconolactone decarboxylase